MERQYNFILTQLSHGATILARYQGGAARVIKSASRVALCDDVLYIDGKAAHGWTICVKS